MLYTEEIMETLSMKLKSVYRTLLTEAWFNDGAVISVLRKLGVTYDQFQYLIKNGYSKGQINQLIKYLRDGGYTFQYIIDSLIEKPESAGKYKPNRTFNPNKFPDESGNISSGEKSENDILEEAGTIFTGIDKNVLETFFRNAGGYNEHSINIIKAAKLPVVVAINKIDREGADPQRVRTELSQHNILADDWGGDVPMIEISAKQNLNIDKLLDTLLLVA